jgi:FAD/FMN-containing dehydrogenase
MDPAASWTIDAVTGAGKEISLESAAVGELADSLTGRLYLQSDDGYDAVHKVWNGMFDHKRPAMVVQCTSVDDIRNAVMFASERGLLVSVKGGGHSFPGKSTCDGGMMIDLSQMQSVEVDVEARTARVAGGALLGHLDGAALQHNLVTTAGVVSHTGVGGFTLGGGMGRTDRLHGLAIDNLLAATIVTANGDVLRLSDEENPDLFWAIRGGGGNFGVVTEFLYRLHPFNPTVYGGYLAYSFDQARDLLRLYAEMNDQLPDEANIEPSWIVSEDGKPVVGIEICYAGDSGAGEKALAPLLAFGKRLNGEYGPVSYAALQTQYDGAMAHGTLNYLKSGFLGELSEASIDAMIGNYEGDDLPDVWFQHLGGATSRISPTATAYSHRAAHYNLGMNALWQNESMSEHKIESLRHYYNAVSPHMGGFYTNLNDESESATWGNYGENYPRLSALKAKYDPTNLFRLNANIRPAA